MDEPDLALLTRSSSLRVGRDSRAGTPLLERSPWRFAPGLAVALCFFMVLHPDGAGGRAIVLFLAVQAVGYAVPGMLVWRVARGGRDPGIVDLVMGMIAFHALSVPWYLLIRWAGAPHLVWLLPAGASVVALVVGRRRGLSLLAAERIPAWAAWNGAAAISLGVTMIGSNLSNPSGPLGRWPGTDTPFLLALAGDLKHHMPGVMPFVTGEKLDYHWFGLADFAAGSWLGGQELDVITIVLMPIGLLAVGLAGFGLLGWRFTGSPAAGVVALWLAVLVASVNPLGGFNGYVVDGTFLGILWTGSVTQAYGQVLAVGLLFVVVDLLRANGRRPAVHWALFVVLSFVISGAKASFIPVLGAGAVVALVVAYRRRREWRIVLAMGMVLAAEMVFAQVVLFGGASQGLKFGPRSSLELVSAWGGIAELGNRGLLLMVVFLLAGWLLPLIALGVCGLRSERDRVGNDIASWWLFGMVAGSMVVTLLTTHPGLSQYSFLRAGLGFAYLGVAGSLVRLWEIVPLRVRCIGVIAAPLGLWACFRLRDLSIPTATPRPLNDVVPVLAATLVLVVLMAAVGAGLGRTRGRVPAALLIAGTFALGMGAARTVTLVRFSDDPRPVASSLGPAPIPRGGIEAARFVRAHSDPDSMMATNAHCRLPRQRVCRTTAHWMSAWAERRFVVEGWGYTPTANASGDSIPAVTSGPYWNPALLMLNDEVFLHPTAEDLAALKRSFPVRWLMVDRRFPVDLVGLERLVPDFKQFGQTYVFDTGPG